jgi:hypothetical protein
VKKTDLMKAIEQFDVKIAAHQNEITSLEAGKAILEAVAQDKAKKAKKAPAGAKRVAKTTKATRATAASDNGGSPVAPALFDQQA